MPWGQGWGDFMTNPGRASQLAALHNVASQNEWTTACWRKSTTSQARGIRVWTRLMKWLVVESVGLSDEADGDVILIDRRM